MLQQINYESLDAVRREVPYSKIVVVYSCLIRSREASGSRSGVESSLTEHWQKTTSYHMLPFR